MNSVLQNYEIYLGTIAGSLVHYDNSKKNSKTVYLRNEEKCEITALSWGRKVQEVLIGYKKGHCKIYNLASSESKNIPQVEHSHIVGIVPVNKDVIFATNTGNLYHWTKGKCTLYLKNESENKTLERILINPYDENVLGIAGRSNDIKLYDVSTKKIVFQGKSDRHDELELAQPVCINSFTYLNNATGMDLATVTRQGQIRIYDTRAQRRALKIFKNTDLVYTTISPTYTEHEIIVGSSRGHLQVMDLRGKIKPVKTFKGYMGGLTDIVCDLEEPIVASCCLDRYFRIHNLKEKKMEFEEYIKIQTPRMLMRRRHFVSLPNNDADEINENILKEIKEEDDVEEITENNIEDNKKRQIQQGNKKMKKIKL